MMTLFLGLFRPLKTVAYFQPSLLINYLIFFTADEQVGELKQITNQWSVGLRWMIFN